MWIETIRIEGGTLDGFRQSLRPGLNVLIGGRGTGKSSVVELIRFCLGAPPSSDAFGKNALEHALGVLGDGKVVLTLTNGEDRVEVSRIASEDDDNCPVEVARPLVFSQKEIEQIGAHSQSRMRLVDGFIAKRTVASAKRGSLQATINSCSAEIRSLIAEIADISDNLVALPKMQEKLAGLQQQGAAQRARSAELDSLRKQLDHLTPLASSANVRAALIERSARKLSEWADQLELVVGRMPSIDPWPAQVSLPDLLAEQRLALEAASMTLGASIAQYRKITSNLEVMLRSAGDERSSIEVRAREVRQRIEDRQKGASALDRQIADLSQEIAALASLGDIRSERLARIHQLHLRRQAALDEMHSQSQSLTMSRHAVASNLTVALGPGVRVSVNPLADYRNYASVLNGALRGSGLRYRELAERIVATFSPQEIAILAERGDIASICAALEITEDRAHRLVDGLRGEAGSELLVTEVGDEIVIELLDGTSFKSTDFLSMGQRCTAVLPIILQHKERIIVLDQPEDHLDNAFVVETLVKAIRSRGPSAQTIIATHNPNIPVLGGAEWVAQLDSDGDRCFVRVSGALDELDVVNAITSIMEGGREAFQRRADFYAKSAANDL